MPGLTDLPPEILDDIVALVLVNDQSISLHSDNSRLAKYGNQYSDEALSERKAVLEAYSLSKLITHSFTEGIAAINDYKVPDADFKDELLSEVYQHRVRKGALLSLALSCSALRDIVEPILYRMVELNSAAPDQAHGSSPVTRFLCTMLKRSSPAEHVRELSFRSTIDMNEEAYEQSKTSPLGTLQKVLNRLEYFAISPPSEEELGTWHPDVQHALLFYLLPNLHTIKVTLETALPPLWDEILALWYSSPDLITVPPALQNITELSIIFAGFDVDAVFSVDTLVPALLLPNLHTLYIGSAFASSIASDDSISYDDLAKLYQGKSNIKKLVFESSGVAAEALALMMSMPRELESFTFNFCGTSGAVNCVEPTEIAAALLLQRRSLRKLEIRGSSDHRGGHGEPFPSGVLTSFGALEELNIAVAMFLHRGSDGTRWLWTNPPGWLQDMLPRGLRSLKLYFYNDWDVREWTRELVAVFERKDVLCPLLIDVYLEYWTSAEDFPGLEGEIMRRDLIELMGKGAREAGVRLVVDVDEHLDTIIGW